MKTFNKILAFFRRSRTTCESCNQELGKRKYPTSEGFRCEDCQKVYLTYGEKR